jgi:hypothetical protein
MMVDADAQHGTWRDPDSAWWVKLRRADQHIVEAAGRLKAFRSDEPWTVEATPGPGTGDQNYRFRVHRAVPADLLAVLGDAVHNLRSALDAMAYGLAEQHCGTLTLEQERVTRLPICRDEAAFDGFLNQRYKGVRPRDLYGDLQLKALRSVQPFTFATEAAAHGVEVTSDAEADMMADPAYRLDVLWNVDKHRRLVRLDWFFDLSWWTGSGTGPDFHLPKGARLRDGTVLATFPGPPVGPEPSELGWEVGLSFSDDPFPADVVGLLRSWHNSVGGWIIPRAFATVERGGEPPLMISFRT